MQMSSTQSYTDEIQVKKIKCVYTYLPPKSLVFVTIGAENMLSLFLKYLTRHE